MGILNLLIDYKYYYLTGIKITIALSLKSSNKGVFIKGIVIPSADS